MLKSYLRRMFSSEINQAVNVAMAAAVVNDNNFTVGSTTYDARHRDRLDYDRITLLGEVIKAYRLNPLARRLIKLPRLFALGARIEIECEKGKGNKTTEQFIDRFWSHPINDIPSQLSEWFDERTMTGDLFILFSVDEAGMPLVRALPSENIQVIITAENDYRQELFYKRSAIDEKPYTAYNPTNPQAGGVKHYTINRPVGSVFGESDLFTVLGWLGRYNSWLENRATLNYWRSLFVWILTGKFANDAARKARENEIHSKPPGPGSILVKNDSETWETVAPKLDAADAENDGIAMKKHIAAGMGIPMHFLAEPESSTRTTAEAAGTPTFKTFEEYQASFYALLVDVIHTACKIYQVVDQRIRPEIKIDIHGPDISERDNAALGIAMSTTVVSAGELFDRHLIDSKEYMRLVYRFSGEVLDENQAIPEGFRKPLSQKSTTFTPSNPLKPKVDSATGDVSSIEENPKLK